MVLGVRRQTAGVGLAETLVAVVLVGLVASAALRVLLTQQRAARAAEHRLRLNATFRMVAGFLPVEFRELSTDGAVPDVLTISPTSLVYRAPRGLLFLCQAAGPGTGRLVASGSPTFGFRQPDPERDSLLLFVEGDSGTAADDQWVRVDLLGVGATTCPGGGPGIEFEVTGPPAPSVAGAPVRPFETTELRLYADRTGARWLGLRTADKMNGGWNATQPVVGPLGVDGMVLLGRDADGRPTRVPREIVSVSAAFLGPPEAPFSLGVAVGLRNGGQ